MPLARATARTWDWSGSSSPGGGGQPPSDGPRLVAGRYRLDRPLGSGASGQVWRAHDLLLGEDVAVKLVAALSPDDLRRARREIVALRWARLPGVVGLRDEGREGDDWFIVMDLVEGLPFPGRAVPCTWEELAPVARRLVEVLAGLHALGVVHRDLKPANVAVLPDRGEVVLLDLGLATGQPVARAEPAGRFLGTPAYAAPEQVTGEAPTAATDRYAVGLMLFEALTGELPHRGSGPLATLGRRLREPAPSLAGRVAVPAEVAAAVDALLQARPEARPTSAWAVLEALGGRAPPPIAGDLALPAHGAQADDLRALFHGPDHFLHLPEDAARALWERTGGAPGAVGEELGAWLRAGLGVWEGGAVRVTRSAIARLQAGEALGDPALPEVGADIVAVLGAAFPHGSEEALRRVLGREVGAELEVLGEAGHAWPLPGGLGARPRRSAAPLDTAVVLRTVAETLAPDDPGRIDLLGRAGGSAAELAAALGPVLAGPELAPERALALVATVVAAARAEGDLEVEARLLHDWAAFALLQEAMAPVERALYEVQRFEGEDGSLAAVEALLRVARSAYQGSTAQLRSQVGSLAPLPHEELEIWRCAFLVHATRYSGDDAVEQLLDGLWPWASGQPERAARVLGWRGNLRYQQGRFAESAALHEEAARNKARVVGRVSSLRNAAAAWLEAGELDRAEQVAGEARALAARSRLARYEALAAWCQRSGAARAGRSLAEVPGLVEAAFAVHRVTGGQVALGEAMVAWRSGRRAEARSHALRALDGLTGEPSGPARLLAELVVLLSAEQVPALEAVEDLCAEARRIGVPGLLLQVAGLLGQRLGSRAHLEEARAIFSRFFSAMPDHPLELTSAGDAAGGLVARPAPEP